MRIILESAKWIMRSIIEMKYYNWRINKYRLGYIWRVIEILRWYENIIW